MRRLLRILMFTFTAISLLVCVTVVVFWVRSIGHVEVWRQTSWTNDVVVTSVSNAMGTWRSCTIVSEHGRLSLIKYARSPQFVSPDTLVHQYDVENTSIVGGDSVDCNVQPLPAGITERRWHLGGVGFWQIRRQALGTYGPEVEERMLLLVPHWLLAFMTAIAPTI